MTGKDRPLKAYLSIEGHQENDSGCFPFSKQLLETELMNIPVTQFGLNLPLKLTCYSEAIAPFTLSPGLKATLFLINMTFGGSRVLLPPVFGHREILFSLQKSFAIQRERREAGLPKTTAATLLPSLSEVRPSSHIGSVRRC